MKHHLGVRTILMKVKSEQGPGLNLFMQYFSDAKKIIIEPGLTVYMLPDGKTLELYSADATHPPYLFTHGDIVIGYRVGDLRSAVEHLVSTGCILLGDIVIISSSYCYCFMLINHSQVVGLYEISPAEQQLHSR